MGIIHLTGEQLAAYIEGTLEARGMRRHVESCPICQARISDERLVRVLLSADSGSRRGHLDEEELAAYVDLRLPPGAMAEIDRHLAACDRCLAAWLDLREILGTESARSMPSASFDRARRSLLAPHWRKRERIDLGRLLVSFRGKAVNLLHVPPPPRESLLRESAARMSPPRRSSSGQDMDYLDIPAFLRSDPEDGKDSDKSKLPPEKSSEARSPSFSRSAKYSASMREEKSASPPAVTDISMDLAPGLELRVRTVGWDELEVTVVDTATGNPLPEARLQMACGPREDETVEFGGPSAQFHLPRPVRPSRLRVLHPVECEIELEFD